MSDEKYGCPCCSGEFGQFFGIEGEGFAAANVFALKQETIARHGKAQRAGNMISGNTALAPHSHHGDHSACCTHVKARIYTGGPVLTMDAEFSTPEAIAFKGNTILAVGNLKDVQATAGEDADLINLEGRTIMPGFIDPHTHILIGALMAQTMEYVGVTRFSLKDEVLAHIKALAASRPEGEWIVCSNYAPMLQGDGASLFRADLDAAAPNHPVAAMNTSGHIMYANSLALQLAGIEEDVTDPPYGKYGRDESGRLNGEIFNGAVYVQIMRAWGGMKRADPVDAVLKTCADFSRLGLTTMSELAMGNLAQGIGDWGILQQAAQTGKLAQRIRAYSHYSFDDDIDKAGIGPNTGDDLVRVSGIKMIADGSNQGLTGLQREPYLGREDHGLQYMTVKEIKAVLRKRGGEGWQIAIHGNGDKGIDNILEAVEAVQAEGIDLKSLRLRIEHCSILHDEQIEKMKEFGISASFLIGHVHYWGTAMRDKIFGLEKAEKLDRCASVEKAGIGYTLHSDYFVTEPDPLHMVQIAVTRNTWKEPGFVLAPGECASLEKALRAITSEAAWQLGSDHEIGSLEPGKRADFVILEKDPRNVDAHEIRNISVLETWMNGEMTYQG